MEKIYHYILITGEEELYNNITRQLQMVILMLYV